MRRDYEAEELTEWARRLGSAATFYNWAVDRYVTGRARFKTICAAERDFRAHRVEATLDGKKITVETAVRSYEFGRRANMPPRTSFTHIRKGARTAFFDVITRITVQGGGLSVSCAPRRFREGKRDDRAI